MTKAKQHITNCKYAEKHNLYFLNILLGREGLIAVHPYYPLDKSITIKYYTKVAKTLEKLKRIDIGAI